MKNTDIVNALTLFHRAPIKFKKPVEDALNKGSSLTNLNAFFYMLSAYKECIDLNFKAIEDIFTKVSEFGDNYNWAGDLINLYGVPSKFLLKHKRFSLIKGDDGTSLLFKVTVSQFIKESIKYSIDCSWGSVGRKIEFRVNNSLVLEAVTKADGSTNTLLLNDEQRYRITITNNETISVFYKQPSKELEPFYDFNYNKHVDDMPIVKNVITSERELVAVYTAYLPNGLRFALLHEQSGFNPLTGLIPAFENVINESDNKLGKYINVEIDGLMKQLLNAIATTSSCDFTIYSLDDFYKYVNENINTLIKYCWRCDKLMSDKKEAENKAKKVNNDQNEPLQYSDQLTEQYVEEWRPPTNAQTNDTDFKPDKTIQDTIKNLNLNPSNYTHAEYANIVVNAVSKEILNILNKTAANHFSDKGTDNEVSSVQKLQTAQPLTMFDG
jgi:hypothetical protein